MRLLPLLGFPVRKEKRVLPASASMDTKTRTFIENILRVPLYRLKDRTAYLKVGTNKVWASFRACHVTASFLLSTTFKVQGQNTGAEVEDSEIKRLMSAPNPHDSWEEMLYLWVFHIKLTGTAFWYKDQMDTRGRPKYLYPLLPQNMAIVPHATDKISHYLYRVGAKEIRFERDEIIFFKRPHAMKITDGLGDIEPSEQLYQEYITRGDIENRFLKNGAMPSGILTKRDATEDSGEWAKLKSWWTAEYEGDKNVGKTAFLNGDWEYTKMGLSQQEMQSIESEKWSVEQIFINHGVPLSVGGISQAANYATARQDEINFRKYEIVPLLDILVGKLNAGEFGQRAEFIKAFNANWKLVYEVSGLIDVEQTVKEYRPLVLEGAMSLNELRELVGLERKNDALLDQHFINSSRLPLEMAGLTGPSGGGGEPGAFSVSQDRLLAALNSIAEETNDDDVRLSVGKVIDVISP